MNKRRIIILILVVALFILIPIIIFLLSLGGLFNKEKGFNISNIDEYLKKVDPDDKNFLLSALFKQVKNFSDADLENNLVEGEIRDGSYSEKKEGKITTSVFLLDIDAIGQTYRISFPWSYSDDEDTTTGLSIDCPPSDQSKFPDNYCESAYTNSSSIEIYLPYTGNVDGQKYEVKKNYLMENELKLFMVACGNDDLLEAAKADFVNWINNTKFLENIYDIDTVDTCTQFNSGSFDSN